MSLSRRVESIAEELLLRGRHQPGAPVRELAEKLGWRVVKQQLPTEGLALRDAGTIVVSPTGYLARDEFTLAHELIEMVLPREWRLALQPERKEALVDFGAAALLLPRGPFLSSVVEEGLELPALRRRWARASWAVIARRLVDIGVASTAASWRGRATTWRHGTQAHPAERVAVAQALRRGRAQLGPAMAWRVRGRAGESAVAVARG